MNTVYVSNLVHGACIADNDIGGIVKLEGRLDLVRNEWTCGT